MEAKRIIETAIAELMSQEKRDKHRPDSIVLGKIQIKAMKQEAERLCEEGILPMESVVKFPSPSIEIAGLKIIASEEESYIGVTQNLI